jgi:hypothetical protein
VKFLITRKSCRKANISFSDKKLAKLIPLKGLTPQQVAELTSISANKRHWLLVYTSGATDRILREHACWCARQALALVKNPDPQSIQAIEVAERYARGEATKEELNIARKAADDAAWHVNTTVYAANAAAVWTAHYAAKAAAHAAADAAAWYAGDFTATWEAQVKDLVSRLTENNFLEITKTKQISRWKNLEG